MFLPSLKIILFPEAYQNGEQRRTKICNKTASVEKCIICLVQTTLTLMLHQSTKLSVVLQIIKPNKRKHLELLFFEMSTITHPETHNKLILFPTTLIIIIVQTSLVSSFFFSDSIPWSGRVGNTVVIN